MGAMMLQLWIWVQSQVKWVRQAERGQGLVEYALIIALIAILVITALLALKGQIIAVFTNISNALTNS